MYIISVSRSQRSLAQMSHVSRSWETTAIDMRAAKCADVESCGPTRRRGDFKWPSCRLDRPPLGQPN